MDTPSAKRRDGKHPVFSEQPERNMYRLAAV
jgi:hypothetical protein